VLDTHDAIVRAEHARYGGREVNTTGDGFVVSFDSPTQAVSCGRAIVDAAAAAQVPVRVGAHTGECERRGDDLAPDPFAVVLVSNHQLFESGEIQLKLAAIAQCFDRFDEDEIRCAGAETRGRLRRKDEKFSRFKVGGRLQADLSEMRDRIFATGGHFFELLENKAIEAIARVGRARVKRQHQGTDDRYR
jgi:class 3 adenylate cyclase